MFVKAAEQHEYHLCTLPTHHNCFRYCHRSEPADMKNLAQFTQPEQSTKSTQSISTKLFLEPLTTSRLNQLREIGLLPSEGKHRCCYQNVRERGTPRSTWPVYLVRGKEGHEKLVAEVCRGGHSHVERKKQPFRASTALPT